MLTLGEIKERLKDRYDPDFLVEILEVSSEEIVEAFEDKIESNIDIILEYVDGDE